MAEAEIHRTLAWGVIGLGLLVFVLLLVISAPYGRHGRGGWGPTMPTRAAWVVMESPPVLAFLGVYLLGQQRAALVPLIMLALWQLHYVNRAFVYPFRLEASSGSGRRTPLAVVAMGIAFNLVNAYLNARHISELGSYSRSWLADPRFLVGVLLFLGGRQINLGADASLLQLKRKAEGGYAIPRGPLFRWISCPNYLGEIIEWGGWALLTWSLAGLSFAVFTFANLAPRALAHHRWYRQKFADYPEERRALIPGLW